MIYLLLTEYSQSWSESPSLNKDISSRPIVEWFELEVWLKFPVHGTYTYPLPFILQSAYHGEASDKIRANNSNRNANRDSPSWKAIELLQLHKQSSARNCLPEGELRAGNLNQVIPFIDATYTVKFKASRREVDTALAGVSCGINNIRNQTWMLPKTPYYAADLNHAIP